MRYGSINYAELNSPEQQQWKAHRELLLSIPNGNVGYRGCIGLGLIVDTIGQDTTFLVGEKTLIADKHMSWASLIDVPAGHFMELVPNREVHWASLRPTTMRYGLPTLAAGTETRCFDFRSLPFDKATYRTYEDGKLLGNMPVTMQNKDWLNSNEKQLFRTFNALELAMTSTAFQYRTPWVPHRDTFYSKVGILNKEPAFLFGNGLYRDVPRPSYWMPKAYIAFPEELRDDLYNRVTRWDANTWPPSYAQGLQDAFLDAAGNYLEYRAKFDGSVDSIFRMEYRGIPVVEITLKGNKGEREVIRFFRDSCVLRKGLKTNFVVGEVLGEEKFAEEVSEDWFTRAYLNRWNTMTNRLLPYKLDPVMRLWFNREALQAKPGLLHYSAQMASPAALSSSLDSELLWEMSESVMEFFNDDTESFIFPTLRLSAWDWLLGVLPGDVHYDFTPVDPRFETVEARRRRVHKDVPVESLVSLQ